MFIDQPVTPQQEWKWKPLLEIRYRHEQRNDRDFDGNNNDNRSENLERFRFGLSGSGPKGQKLVIQFQSGVDDFDVKHHWSTSKNSDVQLGYLELPFSGATYTVGRQTMALADGRLLCSQTSWGNMGRTFDGIHVKSKTLDVFALREGVNTNYDPNANISGVAYNTKTNTAAAMFHHAEKTMGPLDTWVLNDVYKTKIGGYALQLEGAYELGRASGKDLRAWLASARINRTSGKLKGYLEANVASGGSSSDKNNNFDPIYSGWPSIYGLRTMQGQRNIQELTFSLDYKVTQKTNLTFLASSFWLFDKRDAWYSATGTANKKASGTFLDATGNSGNEIGQALQFEVTHKFDSHNSIWAGVGALLPGEFIRNQVTGNCRTQQWAFASYTYKF